jgi:ornithine decarboxylase
LATTSTARLLFNRTKLLDQVNQWRAHLPGIAPHYAVKANNDPQLLRWLRAAGAQFDCASVNEMREVLRVGATPADIIYAQPCKAIPDIRKAQQIGVPNTVVDSVEEVQKLAEGGWRGGTLIRLMVPDAGSAQPFSRKFGAPIAWASDILYALKHAKLKHTGWSFHVGSGCTTPAQYRQAIELCATGAAMRHANTEIVDIGGGFVPDREQFAAAASAICGAKTLFPLTTRWIGEPGRFLCAPVATAEIEVIGRKPRLGPDGRPDGWRYTVDESVYGLFSNIPFDGFRPEFKLLATDAEKRDRVPATVFGRTCDSADCLAEDVTLPELHVGDRLQVENMGAYTLVSASEFNGFPKARRVYDEPLPELR